MVWRSPSCGPSDHSEFEEEFFLMTGHTLIWSKKGEWFDAGLLVFQSLDHYEFEEELFPLWSHFSLIWSKKRGWFDAATSFLWFFGPLLIWRRIFLSLWFEAKRRMVWRRRCPERPNSRNCHWPVSMPEAALTFAHLHIFTLHITHKFAHRILHYYLHMYRAYSAVPSIYNIYRIIYIHK